MSVQAAIYETAHGDVIQDIGEAAEQCVISTNRRGFADAQVAIGEPDLDEQLRLAARAAMPHLGAHDGAHAIYEGRVEDPPIGGATLGLRALGYARAFDDLPYTALWSDTSYSRWRPLYPNERTTAFPERWRQDTQEHLYFAPEKNSTVGTTTVQKGAWYAYKVPDQSTRLIVGLQFSWEMSAGINWELQTRTFDTFVASSTVIDARSSAAGATSGALHLTFTGRAACGFFHTYNQPDVVLGTETGAIFVRITNLRVVTATTNRVNTTLTVARTNGSPVTCTVGSTARMYVGQQLVINSGGANSETVTVLTVPSSTTFTCNVVNAGAGYAIGTTVQGFVIYADEIAKDLVATVAATNASQISAATGLISSPGLDLTDEVYEDTRMSDILDRVAAYGDPSLRLWNWWVAKDKTLVLEVRAARAYTWYVDVTADNVQIERSADDMANSVYVVFQDTAGGTVRSFTATDTTSVQRYGVTRRIAVPASTTNTGQIHPIRDTTLAEMKAPQPRIRITVDRLFDAGGNEVPLWSANAGRGDMIVIRNLSPVLPSDAEQIRRFRLGRTTVDLLAGTLTLESEDPVSTLDAILAAQARSARARQSIIDHAVAAPETIHTRFRRGV